MPLHSLTTFSRPNQRLILLLIAGHLLWSGAIYGLWAVGRLIETATPWLAVGFLALQLCAAAQLLLPVLLLQPEERNRGFYLFWGLILVSSIWLINQIPPDGSWQSLLAVVKSGLLLLVATLIGAALARYVKRLWEVIPIGIAMAMADFASWLFGPTATFSQQIEQYYLDPVGPAPLIDMVLVKLVFPGVSGLAPVFGISDWIIVSSLPLSPSATASTTTCLERPAKHWRARGRSGATCRSQWQRCLSLRCWPNSPACLSRRYR